MLTRATVRSAMRLAVMLLALALLAGCGDDTSGGSATPPSGGSGKKAGLSGPLSFNRTGGLRFVMDELVVEPDGSGTLKVYDKSQPVKLDGAQMDSLLDALAASDLAGAPADSTGDKPIPDDISYRVIYEGRTVVTSSATLTAEVGSLVAELGRLVDDLSKSP